MKSSSISKSVLASTCVAVLISGHAFSASISTSNHLQKNQISKSCIVGAVKATTKIKWEINLNASEMVPSIPFDSTNSASFNYIVNDKIFDSLGLAHDLILYFVRTNNNNWAAHVFVDGSSEIGKGTLEFNSSGTLSSVTGLDNLSWALATGATSPQVISIDMSCSTQFGIQNQVLSFWQDGHTEESSFRAVLNANHIFTKNAFNNSCVANSAHATTEVKWHINLNASTITPDSLFNPKDVSSYNYRTSINVFDSLGAPYYLTLYYVKSSVNTWSVYAYMYLTSLGSGKLVFNSEGNLVSVKGLDNLSWLPYSGADSPQHFSIDMTCSTQYGSQNRIEELPWQNGQGSEMTVQSIVNKSR